MSISPAKRQRVLDRDGWTCRMPRCYAPRELRKAIDPALAGTDSPWAPSLDHIVRECDGGSDRDENLRAAHRWCNQRHGTLAATGRHSALRIIPAVQPAELERLGGTDVASRVDADVAASLAGLVARLEADAAAFHEEAPTLDDAGFVSRTLDTIGAAASDDEDEAMNTRRRWFDQVIPGDWLRHRLGLPCRQPVTGHGYVRATWDGETRCIWLAHPQAGRCFRPARCHDGRLP
jgi:hypothetical protein